MHAHIKQSPFLTTTFMQYNPYKRNAYLKKRYVAETNCVSRLRTPTFNLF